MSQFKTIDYGMMTFEALRNFHALNKENLLSIEYRYTLSMVWPLNLSFSDFDKWRQEKQIIANCKWTIGQVTNVLNYLFDAELKRIYISQKRVANVFAPAIDYESAILAPDIEEESAVLAPNIDDNITSLAEVKIHIPSDLYNSHILGQIISVIEQIKMTGIFYNIIEII
jgi:hypothetical protein